MPQGATPGGIFLLHVGMHRPMLRRSLASSMGCGPTGTRSRRSRRPASSPPDGYGEVWISAAAIRPRWSTGNGACSDKCRATLPTISFDAPRPRRPTARMSYCPSVAYDECDIRPSHQDDFVDLRSRGRPDMRRDVGDHSLHRGECRSPPLSSFVVDDGGEGQTPIRPSRSRVTSSAAQRFRRPVDPHENIDRPAVRTRAEPMNTDELLVPVCANATGITSGPSTAPRRSHG